MNSVLSSKSSTLICGIVYSTMRGASNSFIPKNTTFSGLFDCPIKRNESNNPHYDALSAQPLQYSTHTCWDVNSLLYPLPKIFFGVYPSPRRSKIRLTRLGIFPAEGWQKTFLFSNPAFLSSPPWAGFMKARGIFFCRPNASKKNLKKIRL